jgi:hypothetical protein
MSVYRSSILPTNIETAQRYVNSLNKLKFWLERGVFECSSLLTKDECAEQKFAETLLALIELQRCGFLDEPHPQFAMKFYEFYDEYFNSQMDKEQQILVKAFLEDMFDKPVDLLIQVSRDFKNKKGL